MVLCGKVENLSTLNIFKDSCISPPRGQYTVHCILCTLYSVYCTLYNIQDTLYNVQDTV